MRATSSTRTVELTRAETAFIRGEVSAFLEAIEDEIDCEELKATGLSILEKIGG